MYKLCYNNNIIIVKNVERYHNYSEFIVQTSLKCVLILIVTIMLRTYVAPCMYPHMFTQYILCIII